MEEFITRAMNAGIPYGKASKISDIAIVMAVEQGLPFEKALALPRITLSAIRLGATINQARSFKNQYQVEALKCGIPYPKALKYITPEQIRALKESLENNLHEPVTQLLLTSLLIKETIDVGGTSKNLENKMENEQTDVPKWALEAWAIKAGATKEQALLFTSYVQLKALQAGVTANQALSFTNKYQLAALKAGVTPIIALEFSNKLQILALNSGISAQQALLLTEEIKIEVLGTSNSDANLISPVAQRIGSNKRTIGPSYDSEGDQSPPKYSRGNSGEDGQEQQERVLEASGEENQHAINLNESEKKQKPIEVLESEPDSLFKQIFSALYTILEVLKEFNAPNDMVKQIEKRIEKAQENTCKLNVFGATGLDFIKDDYQYNYESQLKPSFNEGLIDMSMLSASGAVLPMIGENIANIGFGNLIF